MNAKNDKNQRKAVIWGRYSSEQQAEGDSKDRQNRLNRALAEREGIKVITEYFDEGTSVKTGATPLFKDLIAKLPKDVGIICENLDRINRGHPWRAKAYIADILEAGHFIITSQDNREYNADNISLIETMLLGDMATNIAYAENSKRIKRVKEAKNAAIDLARKGIPSPLGAWLPSHIKYNFDTKRYDINELNKEITTRIFLEYLSGKGTSNIARGLNINKVITFGSKKAGEWTRSTISKLLRYEGVIGTLTINKERMPKAFPAAVSEILFYQVQAMLKNNVNRHGRLTERVNNIFRGICHCAQCGNSIKVMKHKYIGCSGFREHRCKTKNMIPFRELEFTFANWFIPHAKDALLGLDKGTNELDALKGKLNAIADRITNTVALLDKGYAVNELEKRLNKLESEKDLVENELKSKQAEQSSNSSLPDTFNKLSAMIDGILDNNDIRKQVAALVPTIVKSVIIDISDKDFPKFECHLINDDIIKWEYDIVEFKQHIMGIGKDGKFILGKPITTDGNYKQVKDTTAIK